MNQQKIVRDYDTINSYQRVTKLFTQRDEAMPLYLILPPGYSPSLLGLRSGFCCAIKKYTVEIKVTKQGQSDHPPTSVVLLLITDILQSRNVPVTTASGK